MFSVKMYLCNIVGGSEMDGDTGLACAWHSLWGGGGGRAGGEAGGMGVAERYGCVCVCNNV